MHLRAHAAHTKSVDAILGLSCCAVALIAATAFLAIDTARRVRNMVSPVPVAAR